MSVPPASLRPCAALLLAAGAAVAQTGGIPSGGRPSLLHGVQPFTQRLVLLEELGVAADAGEMRSTTLPAPAIGAATPDGAALDAFIGAWPVQGGELAQPNPWRSGIEVVLGRLLVQPPADARPADSAWSSPGRDSASVRCATAVCGARTNLGARDARQRHGYALGEFAPGGLWHNTAGRAGFEGTTRGFEARFHPALPLQDPRALWTFDGTLPGKLLQTRVGAPLVLRVHDALPVDPAANFGFGAHSLSIHEHGAANPATEDGLAAACMLPGQHWDYAWRADDEAACSRLLVDHGPDHAAQNIYKGVFAVEHVHGPLDAGNEALDDGRNLRLPSGSALPWGNRDYDIDLVLGDKAWDGDGQLRYDPFQADGFLGDRLLVNWQYQPWAEVRARRYRLRFHNACVSRALKPALVRVDSTPFACHLVAVDGTLLGHAVPVDGTLPVLAPGQSVEVVVDFAACGPGARLRVLNLLEHASPRLPERVVPPSEAGDAARGARLVDDDGDGAADRWQGGDPCVGAFLELRVVAATEPDRSVDPRLHEPGRRPLATHTAPTAAQLASAPRRSFEFGRGETDYRPALARAEAAAASVAGSDGWEVWTLRARVGSPRPSTSRGHAMRGIELWERRNNGGWLLPVHLHSGVAQVLSVDGQPPPPELLWARTHMFRLGGGPEAWREVEIAVRATGSAQPRVELCPGGAVDAAAALEHAGLPRPLPGFDGAPQAEVVVRGIEVEAAEWSSLRGWRVRGRAGADAAGLVVSAALGADAGAVVGSAVIGADGSFLIRAARGPRPSESSSTLRLRIVDHAGFSESFFTRAP